MKTYSYVLLTLGAILLSSSVLADGSETEDWGAMTNSAQMSIGIKVVNEQIKTNQSVILLIRVRNASTNGTVYLDEAFRDDIHPITGISLVVISPSGGDVSPPIGYGAGSATLIRVPSNEVKEFEFDLDKSFRFNEVGTYKLVAKKVVWFADGKGFELVSNPLRVTIVP